jgi:hypothetical protein
MLGSVRGDPTLRTRAKITVALLPMLLLGVGCSLAVATDGLTGGAANPGPDAAATDAQADTASADTGSTQDGGGPPLDGSASTPGLLGRWDFETLEGSSIKDSSGRSHSGAIRGNPTLTPGRIGASALLLDGQDDYIELGTSSALRPAAAFTVSAWVKPADFGDKWGGAGFIMADGPDCCTTTEGLGLGLHLGGGQAPRGYIWRTSSEQVDITGTGMTANNWHNVVFTFDGTALKLYQDGTLTKTQTVAPTGVARSAQNPLLIGRVRVTSASSYPFHGAIDDVRLYDRAISPAEVTAIFSGK